MALMAEQAVQALRQTVEQAAQTLQLVVEQTAQALQQTAEYQAQAGLFLQQNRTKTAVLRPTQPIIYRFS
jgi:hypothetical protein